MSEPTVQQTHLEINDRIHIALHNRDSEDLRAVAHILAGIGDDEFAEELVAKANRWDREDE